MTPNEKDLLEIIREATQAQIDAGIRIKTLEAENAELRSEIATLQARSRS